MIIENLCIIDTETTGLSPDKGDKLIEIAAVLYNVKHKTILQCYSTLLPCETNPVEHINKISAESTQVAYSVTKMPEILTEIVESAQVFVAHNADFDKNFTKLLPCADLFNNKKWICTQRNFQWPFHLERWRLQDICFASKVPYVKAHRALNDCFLLAECFSKVPDLESRFN